MATLPTWDELTDLDKGAALLYLSKADSEGTSYARKHYPCRYHNHPALTALDKTAAAIHAEGLFDDGIGGAYDALDEGEGDRLYDLATAAEDAMRLSQHAVDADKWRRVERALKRAANYGNMVDPDELLKLADRRP